MSAMFINGPMNWLQLCRHLRIPNLIRVEVGNIYAHPVFYVEGADIVQARPPAFVFRQVLSHMMGEKDVAGITTIHYSLGHVDTGPSHICPLVHVHYPADRPAVNAHADLQTLVALERAADLYRTLRRVLRTLVEDQRHAVAGRDF